MNVRARAGARGFTLLEVLIAMSIFALISAMTFQGLQTSMTMQEKVEATATELSDVQLVMTLMLDDFMNVVRRPVRAAFGVDRLPAFDDEAPLVGGSDDSYACEAVFTRAGLPPGRLLRAGLQRVAWCTDSGNRLYRLSWPVLDPAQDSLPVESLLLENVILFEIQPRWRRDNYGRETAAWLEMLPQSIEVTLEVERGEAGESVSFVRRFPGLQDVYPWLEER